MKFTPEMLSKHNFELFIIKNTVPNFWSIVKRPGYAATVSYKLGYINNRLLNNDSRYGIISFLTDGWFCPLTVTKEELCDYFNNKTAKESYRIMTKLEVLYLLFIRKQGFL